MFNTTRSILEDIFSHSERMKIRVCFVSDLDEENRDKNAKDRQQEVP